MAEKINYKEMVTELNDKQDEDLNSQDHENERIYYETFEKLKEIGKELLFQGASRTIRNLEGNTPL